MPSSNHRWRRTALLTALVAALLLALGWWLPLTITEAGGIVVTIPLHQIWARFLDHLPEQDLPLATPPLLLVSAVLAAVALAYCLVATLRLPETD